MSNQQQPGKLWSGRFREPLDRTFEQWQRSTKILKARSAKLACYGTAFCLLGVSPLRTSAMQHLPCSQKTIDKLEDQSDTIRDWSALQTYFHRYQICDVEDADVQEGVSESVVRMLVDHWDSLPRAQKLFRIDPAFEAFALRGINITDSSADLNKLDNLATHHCRPNLTKLCAKIRKAIRENN